MPAIAVTPPRSADDPRPAAAPPAVADPAYMALRIAAGSVVLLGTESTASVSTLRLAEALGA